MQNTGLKCGSGEHVDMCKVFFYCISVFGVFMCYGTTHVKIRRRLVGIISLSTVPMNSCHQLSGVCLSSWAILYQHSIFF